MDSISRQAVIDALENVADLFPWRVPGKRDTYDSYNEAWNDAIGRAEMEIEKLPSVQPYTDEEIQKMQDLQQAEVEKAFKLGKAEIVRCKDCRWQKDQSGSTAWLPCRALITPDDFYCGRAERRADD